MSMVSCLQNTRTVPEDSVNMGAVSQLMEVQMGRHRDARDLPLVQLLAEDGPVPLHLRGPHVGSKTQCGLNAIEK